ncbi:hypothetical protein B0H19DRAFT_1062663 [Mycena capillaripes]|nr:hypothetical protein B0H19DRAFT_1062663 [Mycena capillaripes]
MDMPRSPMSSTTSTAMIKGLGTFAQYPFMALYKEKNPKIPPYPPSLPTNRIEIRQLPVADQPQSCHLLKLPLEVREYIYEHAPGGRSITIQIIGSQYKQFGVIESDFYLPDDDLAYGPIKGILPAERLITSLLLSCRGRNTFYIWATNLEAVVRCGLGYYCLPDIRSVYIYHSNMSRCFSWEDVFAILHQMSLERVAFNFAAEPEFTAPDIYRALLDGAWGRGVLGLRTLRRFELWFSPNEGMGSPEDLTCKKELVEKLQWLMMAGADERYRLLLEEHEL